MNHRGEEHLVSEPETRLVRGQIAEVNVRVRGLQDVAGVHDVVISHPQPLASSCRRLDVDTIFRWVAYRSVVVQVHGHQEAIQLLLPVFWDELVAQAGVKQHVLHERSQRILRYVQDIRERIPSPRAGRLTQRLPRPARHLEERRDDDILRDVHAHLRSGSKGIREVRQLRTLIHLDALGTRCHRDLTMIVDTGIRVTKTPDCLGTTRCARSVSYDMLFLLRISSSMRLTRAPPCPS